jgi:hypothetical protein
MIQAVTTASSPITNAAEKGPPQVFWANSTNHVACQI